MSQSKLASMAESFTNTATGFAISYMTWEFIVSPLYDIPTSHDQTIGVVAIFTVASLARSYIWRRIFNSGTKT